MEAKTQPKFHFDSSQFQERERFFQEHVQLEIRSYFFEQEEEMIFDRKALCNDLLAHVLHSYQQANSRLFPEDFHVESFLKGIKDTDLTETSLYVFNRMQLKEIANARGSSIEDWMQENLKSFSDHIIMLKDNPDLTKVAGVIVGSGLLSVSAATLEGMAATYGIAAPLAPVALEGELALTEVLADTCACLCVPGVVTGVLIAAAVIAVILVAISVIERELSGLIINDTYQDFYIEDIHMEHGDLTAILKSSNGVKMIPAKKTENMVYASFYTIEKAMGFYGTECTMRLKTKETKNAYYFMSANPFAENSRINIEKRNDENIFNAHHYSSQELHQELYDKGKQDVVNRYDNVLFHAHLNDKHGEKAYAVLTISEIIDDYADFTHITPAYYGTLCCIGSKGFHFDSAQECYALSPGGYCCFHVDDREKVSYIIELKTKDEAVAASFYYQRETPFVVENREFAPYTFVPLTNSVTAVEKETFNNIEIKNTSTQANLYFKKITVEHYDVPIGHADWMKKLTDDTPLEDINIPGTHDAAAIKKYYKNYGTGKLYVCHLATITEQLNGGIRLLDIRIKVKEEKGNICFVTCHGSIGGGGTWNEFQSLASLLDECKEFLAQHVSETLICTLKIDNIEIDKKRYAEALDALAQLLANYPIRTYQQQLGTLKESRGKMILFNRINTEERFGYPLFWNANTTGEYAASSPLKQEDERGERTFKVYVQDHYQYGITPFPDTLKFDLVVSTMNKKIAGDHIVYLNYASACYLLFLGVYITDKLVTYFGREKKQRPKNLGWILLDFAFNSYTTDVYGSMDTVSLIIASNFDYLGCSSAYHILRNHQDL